MRLNCPSCTAVLNLSDSLVKKLVRCPKCEQNFVVPEAPAPIVAPKQDIKIAAVPDNYEMNAPPPNENVPKPQNPHELKFCPGCGAPWRKGAPECKKCHYVAALGAQLRPKERKKLNLSFDSQKLYLAITAGAACYGLYMLLTNWQAVKKFINSIWA